MANSTNWVWKNSRAANSALLVLLAIAHEADRHGKDGKAVLSVTQLARKTHLGERTVQVGLRDLVKLGEIEVWPGSGQHESNGYAVRGAGSAPLRGAGYAPRHGPRGADPAGVQNLRGAESAPHKPDSSQVTPPRGADSAPQENDPHVVISTGRYKAQVKNVSEVSQRPDVQRLCAHLADRIEANGSKRPPITAKWQQAARLLIDKDGRTEQQVLLAIDWCQDNEFWRSNILSMPKLREKYEQLRLQATRNGTRRPTRQEETNQLFDRAMERARAREETSDPTRNGHPDPVRQGALPAAGD